MFRTNREVILAQFASTPRVTVGLHAVSCDCTISSPRVDVGR